MSFDDWEVHTESIGHGGKGSGCCIWCDPEVELRVRFEDGTEGIVRHAERSKLGEGFARVQVRFAGEHLWRFGLLTPRDEVLGRVDALAIEAAARPDLESSEPDDVAEVPWGRAVEGSPAHGAEA